MGPGYNDAAVIQGGMSLVPNLRDQLVQDATLELQRRQVDNDTAVIAAKRAEAQREADLGVEYQRDLEAALLEGTPQAIRRLQSKYPAITKNAESAFGAMDEDFKTRTLTAMGGVWERASGKDYAGAAAKLEQRINADKAAGEDTADDEEILAMLRSGNPEQQRIATGLIAFNLRAIAGDKFDAVTKAMEPTPKTADQLNYEWRRDEFGRPYAVQTQVVADSKVFNAVPGTNVQTLGPDPSLIGGMGGQQGNAPAAQGGGDPSGSGAGVTILPRSARPAGLTDDQLFEAARKKVEQGASVDVVFRQLREWGVEVR